MHFYRNYLILLFFAGGQIYAPVPDRGLGKTHFVCYCIPHTDEYDVIKDIRNIFSVSYNLKDFNAILDYMFHKVLIPS